MDEHGLCPKQRPPFPVSGSLEGRYGLPSPPGYPDSLREAAGGG